MYEESVALGIALCERISSSKWALGDLGAQFRTTPIDGISGARPLTQFAHDIGLDERRLQEYVSVAVYYPPSLRANFEALRWTHFRDAKRYCVDLEDALDALEYAATHLLSTPRFTAWLVEHKNKPRALKLGLEQAIRAIRELNPDHPLLSELERILHG